jgi:NhaP-type Na+/H+ or K+/H+ antiporter
MSTWRLLGIAMPLTILTLTLLGTTILGVGTATALLLAAALAPTDPCSRATCRSAHPARDRKTKSASP